MSELYRLYPETRGMTLFINRFIPVPLALEDHSSNASQSTNPETTSIISSYESFKSTILFSVVNNQQSVVNENYFDPNEATNWVEARERVIGENRVYEIDNDAMNARQNTMAWLNQYATNLEIGEGPLVEYSDDDLE